MRATWLWSAACLALGMVFSGTGGAWGAEPPSFERDVRPVLKAYCLDCHGGSTAAPKAGLDLRLRRFVVKGGEGGPAVVPGNPDESLLLERVRAGEMPPGEKKVPAAQVAVLERWIAAGAPATRPEPEKLAPGPVITAEERSHWAYQPVRRPDPPRFGEADRVRTPVDAFLLARLRAAGRSFAPDADRRTLLRRLSLDLTGLPPSREEVQAFESDQRLDAYERVVDRLLASPRYGERWARHWLDAAGYADSEGDGTADTPRPFAWRYRDYVVRALNADESFDQFLAEQLAGDELVPRPWNNLTPAQAETLAATGFLRNPPDGTASAPGDEAAANQNVAEVLKVVGTTLLGLTVGCAQCHDHRYDPIPQADYYRLRAVFEPALDPKHWRAPAARRVSLYTDADRARAAAVEAEAQKLQAVVNEKTEKAVAEAVAKELAKFPEPLRTKLREARETPAGKRSDAQKKLLAENPSLNINAGVLYQYNQAAADALKAESAKVQAKRAEKPPESFVSLLDEPPGQVAPTYLFHRGDYRQPKDAVGPGDLTIAGPEGARCDLPADDPSLPTTGRRLAYARQLTSGKHPLFGRAVVNRVWLHHFGRGIVETPGDFGALGTLPTHPELLDWLADEFARRSWSLKALHRVIVTSTAYRQSSLRDGSTAGGADESLYARYPLHRLDAEALRDAMLAVAGRLDATPFGPAVPVAEDAVGQVEPAKGSPRRSVYLEVKRTRPVSLLSAFDLPTMAPNCDRRTSSTSAPQSLVLMNGTFVRDQAAALAKRVLAAGPADPKAAVARAWELAYQRPPSPEELSWASDLVAAQSAGGKGAAGDRLRDALTNVCQQLLISNEFLYVD